MTEPAEASVFPLSYGQQSLWYAHQVTPGTTAYHVPVGLRLRGRLDLAALRTALDGLTARHEVLRTGIGEVDGTPYQRIPAVAAVPFELVDATGADDLDGLLGRAAGQPFPLGTGPLIRATVFRLGAAEHVLLLCAHHLALDGHSLPLLLDELATGYNAVRRGAPVSLPELPIQYADYAAWQRERYADPEAYAADVAYWRDQLDGVGGFALDRLAVAPGTVPATAVPAGRAYATVPAGVRDAVRRLAARHRTTPMVVLLAAWSAMLARHAAAGEATVLLPVANRSLPETERLVGFLVNTVPARIGVSGTVTDLLAGTHRVCAGALGHQELPFEKLVEAVPAGRRGTGTPYSDVMFAFQGEFAAALALDGLTAAEVDVPPGDAKCGICVELRDTGEAYQLRLDYRTDRYAAATAHGLLDDFGGVLRQLLDDDTAPVERLTVPDRATGSTPPEKPQPQPQPQPPGDLTVRLRGLIADVLELPAAQVGADDDFFALGGNSLLATRLVARARTALAVELPARVVFEQPTAAGVARWLAGTPGTDPEPPVTRRPRPASWTDPAGDGDAETWRVPASPGQERLWFLSQLEPGSAAYHVPAVLRVEGELDAAALERAVAGLVRRHEVLRTRLDVVDGRPVQCVAASGEPAVRRVDVSAVPAPAREDDVRRLVAAETARPFDLREGPLLRVLVVREAPRRHRVVLTMHHVVADGWSVPVLVRDLAELYRAETTGTVPELPELPVQYADHALWQAERLTGDRLAALTGHWRTALGGAPTVLELATDRPRPATPTYRGADLPFAVPAPLAGAVRTLADRYGVTTFMVLLAALGVTLCRHTGQSEVLIGSPVAHRERAEVADLIGFFVNTLVLRVDTAGDPTVAELLTRVRDRCVEAYAHQELPFEKLVEALTPRRDMARSPLFQVMLALQQEPVPDLDLPGLSVRLEQRDAGTGKFDLTVVVEESGDAYRGVLRYNTDLFDAATADRLAGHFLRVLEQLAAAPERRVGKLRPLTAGELHRQLESYHDATAGYDAEQPLQLLVERQIDAAPDAVALRGCLSCDPDQECSGETALMTYRELGERSAALAARLAAAGVRRGDLVAVLLDRSADLVVAELAALRAGAGFVPLDPTHPAVRNAGIVADAGCRLLLTSRRYAGHAGHAAGDRPVLALDAPERDPEPVPTPSTAPPRARDVAYAVYTSGSTGRPKGAVIEHRAITNNLLWMQQDWPLGPGDRLLFKTVHTFDVAVKEVFWPLLAGAEVVLAHPGTQRDAYQICRQIARHRASVVHLVPSMLEVVLQLAAQRGLSLESLRIVMSGAEPLSPATHDALLAAVPALLLHMYGPTETAIAVTGWPCRDPLGGARLPLGRAMPNVRLYVLDDQLRVLPEGAVGELYVGGLAVGRGYLNRPAETAAAFLPDPYHRVPGARMYRTGDLVRYRNDGLLEFRGRRDDQVKLRGLRIEPGEVATVLSRHPGVRQSTVVPWPPRAREGEPRRTVALAAYAAVDDGVNAEELRGFLAARLPGYLVPSYVELVPSLPTGPNGKVDHSRLPAPGIELSRRAGQAPPTTDTERRLVALCCELLELPAVGVTESFFDVGGHSLLATRLVTRIQDEFGVEIPLRSLFAEPTISTLAKLVDEGVRRPVAAIPLLDRTALNTRSPGPPGRDA